MLSNNFDQSSGLNEPYIIEIIKDVRKIIKDNQINFFTKISELLYYRKLHKDNEETN